MSASAIPSTNGHHKGPATAPATDPVLNWTDYSYHPAYGQSQENEKKKADSSLLTNEYGINAVLPMPKRIAPNTFWGRVHNDAALLFRQSLMARGPGGGNSWLIDKNKDLDDECGYPRWITPWQYRYMYDREGIATRIVDLLPTECWAILPEVYEDEDKDSETAFEKSFREVDEANHIFHYLKRADKQTRISYYGIMLYGLNDGLDLRLPVKGIDGRSGERIEEDLTDPGSGEIIPKFEPLKLLYLRTFDETQVRILSYDGDRNSPRYAQPYLYYVRFIDVVRGETGAIAGTVTAHVHWTRVEHFVDEPNSSEVFGTPALQNVYNRVYDLRKILSSSGEMFYKGGFPGWSFEINPEIAAEVELDEDELREEFERYSSGLQRYLALKGLNVKSLAPQVANPKNHFDIQIRAIAISKSIPIRILMGMEQQQRTSSTEEVKGWNKFLAARQEDHISIRMLRPVINRLIRYGILVAPESGRYFIEWPDLNTVSDADKAELAFKRSQALAQYINGFVYFLIPPKQYFVTFLYIAPDEADEIIYAAGGVEKIIENLKNHFDMQANSLDGGVQTKTSPAAGDQKKAQTGKKPKTGKATSQSSKNTGPKAQQDATKIGTASSSQAGVAAK